MSEYQGQRVIRAAARTDLGNGQTNSDVADKPITNTIGLTLVYIPPGTFQMGSPASEKGRQDDELQHEVKITRGFYLGTTEVTIGQFRKFVTETGYRTEAEKDGKGGWGFEVPDKFLGPTPKYTWQSTGWDLTDEHPVVNVTWSDSKSFCEWLGRKEKKTYRLPTEAEWEYACRAKTKTAYSSGDDPESLAEVANVADGTLLMKFPGRTIPAIAAKDGYVFTAPVGKFRSNAFGLFDMHGNVWEWCEDWYAADYYKNSPGSDPTGPATGSSRVFRGGGWYSPPGSCRAAARFWNEPTLRRFYLGFRLLRAL
jgi:formylglycine-generating enzyme required for sulfatase activity